MTSKNKHVWIILAATLLWGTTGTVQHVAPAGATPLGVAALRMLIGGCGLALWALVRGKGLAMIHLPMGSLVASALTIGLYQPLFFMAVKGTGVAVGTVVALGSAPIFTGGIQWMLGEKIHTKWLVSTSTAIIGCGLIFSQLGTLKLEIWGVLFALGAGLSYSIYVQVSKRLFQVADRKAVNGGVFFCSAVLLSPLLVAEPLGWFMTPTGSLTMLYMGLVATTLAYSLFSIGLKGVATHEAVTLTLGEPLTAAVLGLFFLGESLNMVSSLGLVLIALGLLINTKVANNKQNKRETRKASGHGY